MPSASWADGRAMFTMLASSTTINCATAMTTSASHRRGSTPVGVSFWIVVMVFPHYVVGAMAFIDIPQRTRHNHPSPDDPSVTYPTLNITGSGDTLRPWEL